jgi:ABC-type sugar transport system permease subunit
MKTKSYKIERRNYWFFIAPALGLYTLLWIVPMLLNVPVSFTNWNGVTPLAGITWVGFRNYLRLIQDEIVSLCLQHNIFYMAITVIFIPATAFILAICIEKFIARKGFFRTVVFIPVVLPMLLVAMLFMYAYKLNNGLLNGFLETAGLGFLQRDWLGNMETALAALTAIPIWKSTPFSMTIILAGLQTVSKEMEEAADIDGANFIQTTWYITIPQLLPVLTVVFGLVIIDGFRMFDLVYMTTDGGPGYFTTEVISTYIYKNAFQNMRLGYATTLSIMNIAIVGVISAIYLNFALRLHRKGEAD